MPRHIKMDCPECGQTESLTVAFGRPYEDFGDGASEDDFKAVIVNQECECELEDDERPKETVYQWTIDTYPYAIKGEW